MTNVNSLTKEEAAKWLGNLGLAVSGTKKELTVRIIKYLRYPKLINKLKLKASRNYTFKCSLNPLSIPPNLAPWRSDDELYPKMSQAMFEAYITHKKEGSQGQQQKAYRMLQSRKIVSVKIFVDSTQIYVKAMIKKSYGIESRPTVILFSGITPKKAHCNCPVGTSGLCCHVLALLLFLKHFNETGEKILELTCTEQLQKWHRRTKKGSIPMVPLTNLRVKSAKMKKGCICAADPERSYFKRDVVRIIDELNKKLDNAKPVTEHFYSVLSKSEMGRTSSLGEHLCYKFKLNILGDHQYIKREYFETNILGIPKGKMDQIENKISDMLSGDISQPKPVQQNITTDDIMQQDELEFLITKTENVYVNDPLFKKIAEVISKQSHQNIIKLDICMLCAPLPKGDNYVNVNQNTDEWKNIRNFKVTGSRVPSLLGIYGKRNFDVYWDVVLNGTVEKDISGIVNIRRGHLYEKEAIEYFEKESKSTTSICGFFLHPLNSNYGASLDALGSAGILVEIKTRAANADEPLTSLNNFPNYYVQCQLQIACTDAHSCILLSYHPESKLGNFFLIQRNNNLINIIMDICDCIRNKELLLEWHHNETEDLRNLGDKLIGRKLDFTNLKPLRTYVRKCTKDIPAVTFIDEIDFQL